MKIKILGTGCPNCQVLEKNAKEAVDDLKLEADIEKVTNIEEIVGYGVMSTPALVINEKVVSYGKVLSSEEIKKLLN